MMNYKFYNLRSFADIIYASDKECFLTILKQHLKRALLFYEDETVSEDLRNFDFKLLLVMAPFAVSDRELQRKKDVLEAEKYSLKSLLRRIFFGKRITFTNKELSVQMEDNAEMQISINEMIVLASTVYTRQGWGSCDNLQRELQLMA